MTINTLPESRQLTRLCRELARDGYDVVQAPASELLPESLRAFRPDAIACRDDGNLVVVVKTFGGRSGDLFRRLRAAVDAAPGWSLLVSFADPPQPPDPLADPATLRGILATAQAIAEASPAAALSLAWSVLEAASRRAVTAMGERRERAQAPEAVVADVIAFGLAEPTAEGWLRQIARLRNRAAHGHPDAPVDPADLDRLVALVCQILDETAGAAVRA